MNEDVRIQLEKYPYIKKLGCLFIPQEEFEEIYKAETVEVEDTRIIEHEIDADETEEDKKNEDNTIKVSKALLEKILNDDFYYSYTKALFNKRDGLFLLSYPIYCDDGSIISHNRTTILYGLNEYLWEKQPTAIEKERMRELISCISLEGFKKNYNGYIFPVTIDGTEYNINFSDILSLLELNDDDFDDLCLNPDNKDFHGIKKEHFVLAAYQFIKQNRITENYILLEPISDRINDIMTMQLLDVEAIKNPTEIKGISSEYDEITKEYDSIVIDKDLEEAVLSGMNPNYSRLEKAIYVYIMLCKLLTYDEEYYAVSQKGPATDKHKKKEYVEQINLDNNEAVCFEDDLIYSKFLYSFNMPFHINSQAFENEYGEAHANIKFKCDKFLVSADFVTSILRGDMTNAKIGKPLVGLKCLNRNKTTQDEFNEAVNRVYSDIKKNDRSNRSLQDIMLEYRQISNSVKYIPLDEKIEVLFEESRRANFAPIDDYSYILELKNIIFNENEQKENICFSILAEPTPREEKVARTAAIFTVNRDGFSNPKSKEEYYLYRPHDRLKKLEDAEMFELLASGKLKYMDYKSIIEIPGYEIGRK